MAIDHSFWNGRKVLITGHTGFKGSWLSLLLSQLGAKISGFALSPMTQPSLFNIAEVETVLNNCIGDVTDFESLNKVIEKNKPQIIFHLAAQPLVRESYKDPVGTIKTNVMGTANLLSSIMNHDSVRAVVNVTTDKCYENKEWIWAYRENEELGGHDPYSMSKACSELITNSFRRSFPSSDISIATARAGNVIGGGDWSRDRLITDLFNSIKENKKIVIRNPRAIRPWQHVLEPLSGYLMLAEKLYLQGRDYAEAFNFGPSLSDCKEVGWVVDKVLNEWDNPVDWEISNEEENMHEAKYLRLDTSKANHLLDWKPMLSIEESLKLTVEWYKYFLNGSNMKKITLNQINNYFN